MTVLRAADRVQRISSARGCGRQTLLRRGVGGKPPLITMKIGFLLPTNFAIDGAGNGVRAQAMAQMAALEKIGVGVVRLNPWDFWERQATDVVHFYSGGMPMFGIEHHRGGPQAPMLVFSPIIDSNEPNYRYRLAARLGTALPKIYTVPGELRRQAVGANLVICRSEHEKRRLIYGLGIQLDKVRIVLNGASPPAPADPGPVLARLDLPSEFVLHVSSYTQSRKNVKRLVEAVGPTGIPLVIAGTAAPGAELDRLNDLARRFPNIRLLGFQGESDLAALYGACRVFCLPSVHEGTGLVALDAAARGAEIVVTRNGGPPDYFGRWAYYVDPYNVAEIRGAITKAWHAKPNGELRQHVLQNLTWEKSARSLLSAYEELLKVR